MACSEAKKRASRAYAKRHPEKIKAREKNRNKAVRNAWAKKHRKENPAIALYNSSRQNASKKNLAFDLTPEYVRELISPMLCAVSGIALTTEKERGPWAPSIDRIDNLGGYVKGNVRVTCWMFNRAKAHWSDEEFMLLVNGIVDTSTAP